MSNTQLERRDFLLAAATLLENHSCPLDRATVQGLRNLANKLAALESTPAQGVAAHRLVMPGYPTNRFTWVDGDCSPDEESSWATHGWVVERAYGQACASARTAPAEGERQRPTDDDLWDQTLRERDEAEEALGEMFTAVTGRPAEWSSAWHYKDAIEEVEDHIAATTAPVVDLEQFREAVLYWQTSYRQGNHAITDDARRNKIDEADRLLTIIDTARPAKAEGDALVVKLQALVEKWRTASDGAHEEGGHYHAGEVVAYDQCADELENTFHTARPAKAEGDAQDAARYRFARNNMQIAFLNPYRWFPNPLGLDAAIDAAMQEDTARTVSRSESNG